MIETNLKYPETEVNNLAQDKRYIENMIIAKGMNGHYVKYSNLINAVVIPDTTFAQCYDYWEKRYKHNPEEQRQILETLENKLIFGLTPKEEMKDLILNSKDVTAEKEKALKTLGYKLPKPKKLTFQDKVEALKTNEESIKEESKDEDNETSDSEN